MKRYCLTAILLLLFGCKESDRGIPVNQGDAAPHPVSNVEVENLPGGAKISYRLPKSDGLLYVMAQYNLRDSVQVEKKASYYKNSITIEGFPDTKTYTVKLYAVSQGGKKSDAVDVEIKPLIPPVTEVFRSLVMQATFGGVNIQFRNSSKANVKINVITPDSLGFLSTAGIHYTQIDSGDFSIRGYDSVSRKFGVFVRDRWNNYSDTLFETIKPLYEQELDKTQFSEVHLETDTYEAFCCGWAMTNLWDGITNVRSPVFHTKASGGMPQWFTFDLGKKTKLSRFKLYSRNTVGTEGQNGAYGSADPKEWEIWGSNAPDNDGSWASWTLLGHFTSIKPSGQAEPTAEDIQYACVDGQGYDFPVDAQAFRYLRFKTLKTWGGATRIYIAELSFWGTVQE